MRGRRGSRPGSDTSQTWYKDAIIYEVHVRAFADSTGSGTGDFRGLTAKLDYLQDLGVTAVWLLPFYPSPLRDDGYDIADYREVHRNYGTLADFREFLKAAHQREIRVITELVLNHTSDQHPWFQRARNAASGSVDRDYYVWSNTHNRYADARIIFQDFEKSNWTWDATADAYYWHRFYSHQPDLNFDNPRVRDEVLRVLDYWMQMGVDGVRLDAVPYLFEREGTNCENLPETHELLAHLRRHIDAKFDARMLLAEANQWPEDAVKYFGSGDEAHVAFHFPLMPRLFMAVEMEDRTPIIDMLRQTPEIPDACQWALFLRNHDELTLEMVTDEERDYMYRSYARDDRARVNLGIRRRLAPLLGNNRRKIELMVALLMSLPGTPVLYYGDEIGMGDNIFLGDRNAVRTPMQWSADRNAGFSRANPQSLYLPITIDPEYHYEAVNVETQLGNPSSLLWWHRRIIALRKRYPAFGRGDLHMLECENYRVFAFVRRWQNEEILCVANLSRYAQHLELDLAECEGRVPVELFSQNEFPRIKHQPYGLTLGPHSFLWFSLEERPDSISPVVTAELPPVAELAYSGREQDLFRGNLKSAISEAIAVYCRGLEWVKSLHINSAALTLVDIIPIGNGDPEMVLLRVALDRGSPKAGVLMLPARMSKVESFAGIARSRGEILRLRNERSGESVHVVDASNDPAFAHALHKLLAGGRTIRSHMGRLSVRRNSGQRQDIDSTPESFQITRSDQGNLIVAYSRQLMGKFITRPQPGLHPDVEICKVLCPCTTEQHHVPNTLAWVEFLPEGSEQGETIGILQEYVPNLGSSDRWLSDHMERVVECATAARGAVVSIPKPKLSSVGDDAPPEWAPNMADLFRPVSELVESLGRHLAGLHLALSRAKDGGQFAPEPFTLLYQRSLYQSMRNHAASALKLLRSMKVRHDPVMEAKTRQLVQLRQHVDTCFKGVTGSRIRGQRIRIHGDLHLAQILFTGTDFVFLDFEGDASKPLSERRIKRSPLRDLATLLWSIRLIACRGLYVKDAHGWTLIDRHETLEPVTTAWAVTFCRALLKGYMSNPDIAGLLPEKPEEIRALLNAYMLERAFFDLEQVMARGAPEARVVLRALLQMIEYTA